MLVPSVMQAHIYSDDVAAPLHYRTQSLACLTHCTHMAHRRTLYFPLYVEDYIHIMVPDVTRILTTLQSE